MATQAQIDTYITDVRTAVSDYGDLMSRQQRLGKTNLKVNKIKLMLVSAYLDCIYDYFLQYGENITAGLSDPSEYNFFTVEEIRDVMQHLNNICGTFYIIEL